MSGFILTEINIYPIKSLRGISVTQARVKRKGLEHDRRWMLVDDKGRAMTQRAYPRMALFQPRIEDTMLHLRYSPDPSEPVCFNIGPATGDTLTARVWNDLVAVQEVDSNISKWFSERLDTPCRLVAFPEGNPRPVDRKYATADDQVSLADAYPFLLIGQSSLDDLNSRLSQPVSMNRFRPNFVVAGAEPFAEDQWKTVTIADLPFAVVKPCDRCVMTTVNQETAEKGTEPLRTLATFRKREGGIYFGQNLIGRADGQVSVGSAVIPG